MTTDKTSTLIQTRERMCRRLALSLGAFVALVASISLLGWVLADETLKRVAIGTVVMIPLTAMTFLCASIALAIRAINSSQPLWQLLGRIFSGIVFLCGATMLVQRVCGLDLPINTLLFADALQRYPYRPLGLMAANTAFAFTLSGLSLAFPTAEVWNRKLANGLALGVIAIAALALVGYAYGAHSLYSVDRYAAMSLSTAVNCLALGVAIIAANPQHGLGAIFIADDAGAIFTRKLLPIALAVPFLLGLGWLYGGRLDLFGRETGIALVVVFIGAIYTAFLFHGARAVSTLDRDCRDALAHAERARSFAEEANRGKAEFLTMMSHELRTPLNAIRGYAQLMELGIHGPITEEQRLDLARIRRSEEHLLGIIGDILDFASVERGQYKFELASVAIRSVLDEAINAVAPFADSRVVNLAQRDWGDMAANGDGIRNDLEVIADVQKLRQVLINLLSNAIKFTEVGGNVVIDAQPQGDRVLVSVADSGRGIPPERLTTIFEPFTQTEPALTRTTEGIGLGLAITRQLLLGMNCDIKVESTVGVGSRFSILIPRSPKGVPSRVGIFDTDPGASVGVR